MEEFSSKMELAVKNQSTDNRFNLIYFPLDVVGRFEGDVLYIIFKLLKFFFQHLTSKK